MEIIGLFISLILTVIVGLTILSMLDKDNIIKPIERIFVGFLLGEGAISLIMLFCILLPFSFRFIIANILAVVILLFWLIKNRTLITNKYLAGFKHIDSFVLDCVRQIKQLRAIGLLFLLGIIFKLGYAFVETCSKPEYSWDACMNWTAIAKWLLFVNSYFPDEVIYYLTQMSSYPKQITFMHLWIFNWMGNANDQWSKIIFPIGLLCFSGIFYYSLKKYLGRLWALIFTYLLLTTPFFIYDATIGYADFSLAIYFSLSSIFFYRWIKEKHGVYFWLFAIFSALTTWIKMEGVTFYGLGLLLLLIYLWQEYETPVREKMEKILQYFAIYVVIGFPWQIFRMINKMPSREILTFKLNYFFELHRQAYDLLFMQGTWGVFWLIFAFIILISFKRLFNNENKYLLIILLLFYLRTIFVFLFTLNSYEYLPSTFNRLWISVYSISVFTLACIFTKNDFMIGRNKNE